jgi:hypothetical protein
MPKDLRQFAMRGNVLDMAVGVGGGALGCLLDLPPQPPEGGSLGGGQRGEFLVNRCRLEHRHTARDVTS